LQVLVVGASGFIGRHILAEARRQGAAVFGTQASARHSDLIRFDLSRDRFGETLAPCLDSNAETWVVVAAALSQIDRCVTERALSRRINVAGTIELLRDSASHGLRPVFLSSSFVFDGCRGGYGDFDPRAPISEYGRQKAEVEAFIDSELPAALVLRLDKTVGADPGEKHLFSEWLTMAAAGCPIRCIANQVFSPTLVDDIARGVVAACRGRLSGVYNLAGPDAIARADLARQFVDLARLGGCVEEVSQHDLGFADLRPEKSSLDSRRFVAATGLELAGVRSVLESFLRAAGR